MEQLRPFAISSRLSEGMNVMEQLRPFAISSRLSEETDAIEQHVSDESPRAPIGYQILQSSPVSSTISGSSSRLRN